MQAGSLFLVYPPTIMQHGAFSGALIACQMNSQLQQHAEFIKKTMKFSLNPRVSVLACLLGCQEWQNEFIFGDKNK